MTQRPDQFLVIPAQAGTHSAIGTGLPGRAKPAWPPSSDLPFPSFPRKRESRDFSLLPWVPAFAQTTLLDGRRGFHTTCSAGVTING